MRKYVCLFTLICAAAGLTAGIASAQSRDIVNVHLSYDVQMAGKVVPAGEYEIRDLNTAGDVPTLLVHSDSFNMVVPASRVATQSPAERTGLVFDHGKAGYVLERIVIEGRPYVYDIQ